MAKKESVKEVERQKRNNVWELSEYARRELMEKKRIDLPKFVKKRKKQLIEELKDYNIIEVDENGDAKPNEGATKFILPKLPMTELWDFCFSPFIKVAGIVPDYSAAELSVILDYFKECIKQMNAIEIVPPTKEQFCSLCGFSTQRFNELKNSSTSDIREVLFQVEDYICNYLSIGGLTRKISEVSSIFNQKVLGRKEVGDNQQAPQTNNIVIGDSAFAELCGKFGIKEK